MTINITGLGWSVPDLLVEQGRNSKRGTKLKGPAYTLLNVSNRKPSSRRLFCHAYSVFFSVCSRDFATSTPLTLRQLHSIHDPTCALINNFFFGKIRAHLTCVLPDKE